MHKLAVIVLFTWIGLSACNKKQAVRRIENMGNNIRYSLSFEFLDQEEIYAERMYANYKKQLDQASKR